jgi:hypothetical protein
MYTAGGEFLFPLKLLTKPAGNYLNMVRRSPAGKSFLLAVAYLKVYTTPIGRYKSKALETYDDYYYYQLF